MKRGGLGFLVASFVLHASFAAVLVRGGPPPGPIATVAPKEPEATFLSGETFEAPTDPPQTASAPPTNESAAVAPGVGPSESPRIHRPRSPLVHPSPTPVGSSTAEPPPVFGATGLAYAVDLASIFTHELPSAASTDVAWKTAPFGPSGSVIVTLEVNSSGQLVRSDVGGASHAPLRTAIERTLALIEGHAFTASAPVTRIQVEAHVRADSAHDGLHGDDFAIGGSALVGGTGAPFFALPTGRRIDFSVRVLR